MRIRCINATIVVATTLMLFAMPGSAEPQMIKIGAIASLTGKTPIPDTIDGLKAYIDSVNKNGGVKGKRIQLVWEDDGGSPEQARKIARRLIETEKVVAMVGGASVVDCGANGEYYQQLGVVSIMGTGVEDACFEESSIAPVNAGPYVGLLTALKFSSDILRRNKVCVVMRITPGMDRKYRQIIRAWGETRPGKLSGEPILYGAGESDARILADVEARDCEVVVYGNLEHSVMALLGQSASETAKAREWVFLTPGYTRTVASMGATNWKGVYAMSEFMPWSSAELSIRDWKAAMSIRKIPLSSLSQGGYVAGQIFVDVLNAVNGEISRDSIRKELVRGKRIDNGMLGQPFVFGGDVKHNPNRQTIPMRLVEKNWRVSHFEWIGADEFVR